MVDQGIRLCAQVRPAAARLLRRDHVRGRVRHAALAVAHIDVRLFAQPQELQLEKRPVGLSAHHDALLRRHAGRLSHQHQCVPSQEHALGAHPARLHHDDERHRHAHIHQHQRARFPRRGRQDRRRVRLPAVLRHHRADHGAGVGGAGLHDRHRPLEPVDDLVSLHHQIRADDAPAHADEDRKEPRFPEGAARAGSAQPRAD